MKSIKSIGQHIEAIRSRMHQQPEQAAQIAANDTLFKDLSNRWGPGFAQWLMDDLLSQAANNS